MYGGASHGASLFASLLYNEGDFSLPPLLSNFDAYARIGSGICIEYCLATIYEPDVL